MKTYLESVTQQAVRKGQSLLAGERGGLRAYAAFLGPAVIASIAYMDPGNFATNIQGGAQFGYELLWVVLGASLTAMLFQALSAKLGIVTGKSLAEHCRDEFPRPVVWTLWIISEIAAIATDLAEVIGASVGVTLLFNIPMLLSVLIVGIATYCVLLLQGYGFRPMEALIGGFVGVISLCYLAELFIVRPLPTGGWRAIFFHSFVPQLSGNGAVLLAVGIIGATVMPHAIYLHSGLTKNRIPVRGNADKKRVLKFSNREVLLALGVAGLVNMAMLTLSATAFYFTGHRDVAQIETAYHTLMPLFGSAAAGIFMLSLLASGFSSSVVGTMAGQSIMQDFVHLQIPLSVRRIITLAPAMAVVALGVNITNALIASQVILSLVLPIPIAALLFFTGRRSIMGTFANGRLLTGIAALLGAIILSLNGLLLVQLL